MFGVVVAATATGATAATAATAASSGGATPQAPAACTRATLTTFKFSPGTVVKGKSAALDIAATSCSAKGFSGSLETYGRMCKLVLDPIDTSVTITGKNTKRWVDHYSNTNCVGSGEITGNLLYKGKTLATKTAKVTFKAS